MALGDLVLGGVPRTYVQLLERVAERGDRATLLAPPGPEADTLAERGIRTIAVDWADEADAARTVAAVCGPGTSTIVPWDPRLATAAVTAAAAGSGLVVALHSKPERLAEWFGPDDAVAHGLLRALLRSGRAVLLTRGPDHRRGAARVLDVPGDSVVEVPAGVDVDALAFTPEAGDPDVVLAPTRLSPEKLSIVHVAARMTAWRRFERPACRLRLIGDGPSRDEALVILADYLPSDAWTLEPPTPDLTGPIRAAGVVVTQGRTALEAAALGRPVVVTRTVAGERGGAVVTPLRYAAVAHDVIGDPSVQPDAAKLWRAIDRLGPRQLAAVRTRVERHNSAAHEERALAAALARPRPAADPVLAAAAAALSHTRDGRRTAGATADLLWRELELARQAPASSSASTSDSTS